MRSVTNAKNPQPAFFNLVKSGERKVLECGYWYDQGVTMFNWDAHNTISPKYSIYNPVNIGAHI